MNVTTSVAAQIQNLRKIHIPTERDHALKKHLHRLFEVDDDGGLTSVPCRYTAGQETRGIILIEEPGGGKTTAVRTILRESKFLAQNPEAGQPRYLEIQAPSPATLKSVGLAILAALGVEHVGSRTKVWEIWEAVKKRLSAAGISVLWLDEAQDLIMARSANDTESSLRMIKSLMQGDNAVIPILSDYSVERLSKLTGVSEEQVLECGPQQVGDRLLTYQGETFGPAFMTRTHTTYCPACLIDDATEEANGDRVGRLSWMFASVRVCPRHGIFLTRRKNLGYFERFQDMDKVAPSDQELAEQVVVAETASVSPLQTYVVDRLSGAKGPGWMDEQRIDQAVHACETLGVHRVHGAHAGIKGLTIKDWHEAGVVGMEAASQGREGIYAILDDIVREATIERRLGRRPPSAFGRIYDWLQSGDSQQDPGPIRDVVWDFIIDHMPVEPGTILFGGEVLQRKRHTVATLSKVSGLHQKTLNRALVLTGLLAGGDPEQIETRRTFNAEAGEARALRIKNSIPIKKIPDYLNCNRTQAQMMVKTAILKKLADDPSITGGKLSNVANDDLDDFLVSFRAAGRRAAVPSPGMTDVITASEIARVPAADIVALVLEGRLSKVEAGDEDLRFRSVFVDADEVRSAAGEMVAERGVSAKEAADRIGLRLLAIDGLRTAMDVDGQPFLTATMITNARLFGTYAKSFARCHQKPR